MKKQIIFLILGCLFTIFQSQAMMHRAFGRQMVQKMGASLKANTRAFYSKNGQVSEQTNERIVHILAKGMQGISGILGGSVIQFLGSPSMQACVNDKSNLIYFLLAMPPAAAAVTGGLPGLIAFSTLYALPAYAVHDAYKKEKKQLLESRKNS